MKSPFRNDFVEYALRYKCTIAEAIADRDWPASEGQCRTWFTEAAGRPPTDEEMARMGPNSKTQIADEMLHWSDK